MASGDSGAAQSRKLGLKPGQRLLLDRAPAGWALIDPPDDLRPPDESGRADVVIAFFTEAAHLAVRLPRLAELIFPAGALWVAWPRRAVGRTSDISDTGVRAAALPLGIVDVKVAAIDEEWSGLRFVWRTANRGVA